MRHLSLGVVACAALAFGSLSSTVQAAMPTVKVGAAGALMAPSSLPSTYTSAASPAARTRDPLVVELARSLKYDGPTMYEYVRNHIELTPQFGMLKGARGAILDGYGTPFDQAQLLVDLMREADDHQGSHTCPAAGYYCPVYVFGTAQVPLTGTGASGYPGNFSSWFGVADATAAGKVLADGGFPASTGASVSLSHVWVRATIDGQSRDLDPSFKPHIAGTAMNLNNVDNLSKADLQSAAGGSTGTQSTYATVTSLNVSGLRSKLESYRGLIESDLNTPSKNHVGMRTADVLAVPKIDPQRVLSGSAWNLPAAFPTVLPTSLPYTGTAATTWSGEVPDIFRTYFTVNMTNWTSGADTKFYADQVYGKPLVFNYGPQSLNPTSNPYASTQPSALPAGVALPNNMNCDQWVSGSGSPTVLSVSVNHPYPYASGAYMDRTISKQVSSFTCPNGYVVVTNDWGETSGKVADLMRRETASFGYDLNLSSYVVTGPLLHTVAKEYSEYLRLSDATLGSVHQLHDLIGIHQVEQIGQSSHTSVNGTTTAAANMLSMDFEAGVSVNPESGSSATTRAGEVAVAVSGLGMVESAAARDDEDAARDATSLTLLTSKGTSDYIALSGSGARSSASSWLTNYTDTGLLSAIDAYLGSSYTVLLPKDGAQKEATFTGPVDTTDPGGATVTVSLLESTTGSQFIRSSFYAVNPTTGEGAYVIWDPRRGAITKGGVDVTVQDPTVITTRPQAPKASSADIGFSDISVDPKTGDAAYSPPADVVDGPGDFPRSLPFKRRYDPSDLTDYGLGMGWKHNWVHNITLVNDSDTALGQSDALGSTSAMVAIRAIAALATPTSGSTQPSDAKTLLMEAVIHQWLADQTINNVATVTSGLDGEDKFVRTGSATSQTFSAADPDGGSLVMSGQPTDSVINRRLYTGVTFDYTAPTVGVRHYAYTTPGTPIGNVGDTRVASLATNKSLYLTEWDFPDGNKIQTQYQYAPGATSRVYPTSATNSFGAALTLGVSDGGTITNCDTPKTTQGTFSVTAAGGNAVTFNLSRAQNSFVNCPGDSGGKSSTTYWRPMLTSVVDQTSTTWSYTYAKAGTDFASSYDVDDVQAAGMSSKAANTPHYQRMSVIKKPSGVAATLTLGQDGVTRLIDDALGNTYSYYSTPFRGETDNPLSAATVTYFDQYGRAIYAIDPVGNVTTSAYDARDRLVEVTNPLGDGVEYTYDTRGNPLTKTIDGSSCAGQATCAAQLTTSYAFGRTTGAADGVNVMVCNAPATCNQPTSITNARNYVTKYVWNNSNGTLTSITKGLTTGGSCGLTSSTTCPATSYAYGSGGVGGDVSVLSSSTQLVSSSPAANLTTQYNWATNQNRYVLANTIIDPTGLNIKTAYSYDPQGNINMVDGPLANDESYFQWYADRTLKAIIGPDPDGASLQLDGSASLPRQESLFTYTPDGQLSIADLGTTTSTTGASFAKLQETAYLYDAAGGLARKTLSNGAATPTIYALTQYSNDDAGRLQCQAQRMNSDAFSSLPALACTVGTTGSQGEDRITKTFYDLNGRVSSITRAFGTSSSYRYVLNGYDADGQIHFVTDSAQARSSYAYDEFERLTRINYPKSDANTTVNTADNEQYKLDDNGNRTALQKRDGTSITYSYDALDRMIVKAAPASPGGAAAYTIRYDYDLAGRQCHTRTSTAANLACATSAGANGLDYGYDVAGRLTSETSYGKALTYGVDDAGNRTQMTWPVGTTAPSTIALTVNYQYDAMNRMTEIDESGFGAVAQFSYDPGGRRVTQGRTIGTSTTYAYDAADQLKSLANSLASTKNNQDSSDDLTLTFQRNLAGQIVNKAWDNNAYQWTALPAGTTSLTYDHLNRVQTIANDTCAPTGGYDCNGNLVSDGVRSGLTYDEENHLVSGALGSTTVAMTYDPAGRLQQTAATRGASTTTTQFLYSGSNMVAEYDGSGSLLNRYLPGPGTDEWLVQYAYDAGAGQAGQRRHILFTDNQGSVVATTATNGNGDPTLYAYGPNGEPSSWAGSRFRYTGQTAIPELQLYYYKARFYDPASGRFLQTDPIGTKDDLNLYAYVGDDPVDGADPSGEAIETSSTIHSNKNGTTTTIVRIRFTAALRISGAHVPNGRTQSSLAGVAARSIARDWSKTVRDGHGNTTQFITTALIRAGQAEGNEHQISVVSADEEHVKGNGLGNTPVNGLTGNIYISERVWGGSPNASFSRTASHEYGHAAGLYHPGNPIDNLMTQTQYTSSRIVTSEQLTNIAKNPRFSEDFPQ